MGGRGVAVPRAWGRKRERSPIPHRTGCITTPTLDKKGSGVHFRLFEGRLNLYRTVPHADKLLPWLIVCAAAKIQNNQRPGGGKNLCEATVTRPAVVIAFSAIPRNPVRMAVCARVRETVASAIPLRLIAPPRPSWCGGGAFDAPGHPFKRETASPVAPIAPNGVCRVRCQDFFCRP